MRHVYEYDVPYGGRLIDVPIDRLGTKFTDIIGTNSATEDYERMAAHNGNRIALGFPMVDENRLQYYEYGLSGHDRFYWGDRFYSDTLLWGKYKWQTGDHYYDPMPGWDQDYP
jgi:hypothetical protein